jgi:hypothetical protein
VNAIAGEARRASTAASQCALQGGGFVPIVGQQIAGLASPLHFGRCPGGARVAVGERLFDN